MTAGPDEVLRGFASDLLSLSNALYELWNRREPVPLAYSLALRGLSLEIEGQVDRWLKEISRERGGG